MYKHVLIYIAALILTAVPMSGQNPYSQGGSRQPTEWSGTGWALNKGYVVTNYHVVENARTIILKFMQDEIVVQYTAEVVVTDEEHDLAIVKINDPSFKGFGAIPYSVKTAQAEVGESVFVLGYPMTDTMGDEIKLTTGIISSHSGYQGDKSQYQISAPVQPGNSGGPLFDDNGEVIGIVNAKHTGAENVGYAIKATHLQSLVNQLSDKAGVLPSSGTLSGKTLPEKVKKVKGLVCFIYCSTRGETPRSADPKHGAPSVSQNGKVIESPYVDNARTEDIRISKITLDKNATIIEFTIASHVGQEYFPSMSVDKDTYIKVDDQEYKIQKWEKINPKTRTFRMFFPAIPSGSTSLNIVEPGSDWKFYGVSLKEY